MNRIITLSGVEPAPLSIRHPLGINLDLLLTMQDQNGTPVDPTPLYPQAVLLPRSRGGVYPYDLTVTDAVNGIASLKVPGTALTDYWGYGLELYTRRLNEAPNDPPIPTGLAAKGVLMMEGSSYLSAGPLGMVNIPVVVGPQGPKGEAGAEGPTGATGQRGSVWYTGTTDPGTIPGQMVGDMYLDETTGNVWRFDGDMWLRGSFT
jgi:hypothetical protein